MKVKRFECRSCPDTVCRMVGMEKPVGYSCKCVKNRRFPEWAEVGESEVFFEVAGPSNRPETGIERIAELERLVDDLRGELAQSDRAANAGNPESGIARIAAERRRQIEKEGYDAKHDKKHASRDLVSASITYCLYAIGHSDFSLKFWWPFRWSMFKPCAAIRCLEKAGALCAAAIDRMQEAESKEVPK